MTIYNNIDGTVMFHPFPATATNASFVVHHVKFLGGTEVKMS